MFASPSATKLLSLACVAVTLAAGPSFAADQSVTFSAGADSAALAGTLPSERSERYLLDAMKGQFLSVTLTPDNKLTYFTIYTPAGDILFESSQAGNKFYGQLPESGDTAVSVFYKGEPGTTGHYDIAFTINSGTDGKATSPQAGQVTLDPNDITVVACLAAVGKQTNNPELEVLSKEFSEANSAVMIGVGPDKAPWRCLVSNDGVVAEVMFTGSEGAL